MELFTILESSDVQDIEELKQLVNQSLANNKDPGVLNGLVEYYLSTRSQRCLDLLVAIREPNNKYLFDKLLDSLRGKMRLDTLKLITNIVHKQPSWLHCITSHKILSQILGIIKHGDQEPTHIMLANVIVISLMPMLPMQFNTTVLQETFEAFSSLAALCTRKPSHILDTHLSYLRLGLQTLFQHLYGMYPCNFLAYLRGYYGSQDHSRENFAIYTKTIRPLLQRTRLHPLLVTASKEAELSSSRPLSTAPLAPAFLLR
ncbi:hamartin isoform X4 [Ixodes scapularis]